MGMKFNPDTGEPIQSGTGYSPNTPYSNGGGYNDDYTVAYNRNGAGAYPSPNGRSSTYGGQSNSQNYPYGQGNTQSGAYGQGNSQNGAYGQGNAQSGAYGQGNSQNRAYGQGNAQNYPYGQGNTQNTAYGQGNAQNGAYGQGNAQNYPYGQGNAQNAAYGQNTYPGSGAEPQNGTPYGQPPYSGATGSSNRTKKPRKILLPILIGLAAVCAAVAIFFIAKTLLLKPGDQILLAAKKTAKGSQLVEMISESSETLGKGSAYTATVDLSGESYESTIGLKGTFSVDYSKKVLSADGSVTTGSDPIAAILYMDDSKIQAQLPDISQYKLVYDYTTEPTGVLKEALDSSGISASVFNNILQNSWNAKKTSEDFEKDLISITRKNFNDMGWKKTEKRSFTFNDKEIKAKGYTAVLTPSAFSKWIGDYKNSYKKYMESSLPEEYLDKLDTSSSDYLSALDHINLEGDLTINVYLHKSKIVAIVVDSYDGNTFEIDIEGGAYPLENTKIKANGSDVLILHGTTSGDTETMAVSAPDGTEAASYTYNTKSGNFTITVSNIELNGTLKKEKKDLVAELRFSDDYIGEFNASVRISPEATAASRQPTGTEINLNTATSDDLIPFLQDVTSLMY